MTPYEFLRLPESSGEDFHYFYRGDAFPMIDAKTAKKSLLSELGKLLAADGFRAKMADQAFELKKPFGSWIVHVAFIPHPKVDVDATVSACVRIDTVQEVVSEYALLLNGPTPAWVKKLPQRPSRKGATLGSNLGNISGGGQKRWTIDSVEQAGAIAASMYSDVQAIGFPYFERYSNMGNVLKTLTAPKSRDTSVPWSICCERAVALAFVLGDPGTIETVVRECDDLLSGPNCEQSRARIAEFVAALRLKRQKGELPKLAL